jgi:hypothetical protein
MMTGPRIVWSISAYVERAVVCYVPLRRGVVIQADRRRLVVVTSVAEPTKSSDLKLIVYVCYTEEIVDMVVPDVILLYPMHENSKYALDPFMVE